MRKLKYLLVLVMASILGCNDKEEPRVIDIERDNYVLNLPKGYDLLEYNKEEQMRIVFAEALSKIISKDNEKLKTLLTEYLMKDGMTNEILYMRYKDVDVFGTGKTLKEMLKGTMGGDKKKEGLLEEIEKSRIDMAVGLDDWMQRKFKGITDYDGFKFGVNVELQKYVIEGRGGYFPIWVMRTKRYIPVKKGTTETIWGTNLLGRIPALKGCKDFDRDKYVAYSYGDYEYLDANKMFADINNGVICK